MILIFIVGYVCYSTNTGGSSQHSVVVFDLYVAASGCSHLDALGQYSSNREPYSF